MEPSRYLECLAADYARLREVAPIDPSAAAARRPEDPAGSWYTPDQTVGFWIRRMAQETVIHRIGAELGAGQTVAEVPDDLTVDGIDELLKIFVAFGVSDWGEYFDGILANSPGRTYTIRADGTAWRVRTGPGQFAVDDGPADGAADVTVAGDPHALTELRQCIVTATQ